MLLLDYHPQHQNRQMKDLQTCSADLQHTNIRAAQQRFLIIMVGPVRCDMRACRSGQEDRYY